MIKIIWIFVFIFWIVIINCDFFFHLLFVVYIAYALRLLLGFSFAFYRLFFFFFFVYPINLSSFCREKGVGFRFLYGINGRLRAFMYDWSVSALKRISKKIHSSVKKIYYLLHRIRWDSMLIHYLFGISLSVEWNSTDRLIIRLSDQTYSRIISTHFFFSK